MLFIKFPAFMKLPKNADSESTLDDLKSVVRKEKLRRAVWGWLAVLFMASHSIFALITFGGLLAESPWDSVYVINFLVMLYLMFVYCIHRDVHEDAAKRIGDLEKV